MRNDPNPERRLLYKVCGGAIILWAMIGFSAARATADETAAADTDNLLEMSLEELMEVEIDTSSSLTQTTRRLSPSVVTTITQEQIQASGARSLNELLEIYVPNLEMIRHHWESRHLGLRGLINDSEEKYLLLVNGRVMNERTHYGVLSERDLSMLGDIHHIDVIRGPGSAIYGAGAVSMVINVVTDTGMTYQGLEFTQRTGVREEFYSGELKFGKKIDEDSGLLAYFGIDKYNGADQGDAPLVFGTSFSDFWGVPIERGQPAPYKINRDRQAYRDLPHLKAHLQYTNGPWEFWARYTRGGEQYTWAQSNIADVPYGWLEADWATDAFGDKANFNQPGEGYQQLTLYSAYHWNAGEDFNVDFIFSYDVFDFERQAFDTFDFPKFSLSHREDEYLTKVIAHWNINEQHLVAFGGEWSHEEFGLDSLGYPHEEAVLAPYSEEPFDGTSPEWNTETYSVVGEHQWRINDQWTNFTGLRIDKNDNTQCLFSPRVTTVFTPNDKDTWKLILARSMRIPFAQDMNRLWEISDQKSDPEILYNVELRFDRQLEKNLLLGLGGYYHNLDAIAWSQQAFEDGSIRPVGNLQEYGFEAELTYHTEKVDLGVSHGYTKLIDFNLRSGEDTLLTAKPYGYGDDLANWSNHLTKAFARYKFTRQWEVDGNARIYWGFPGARDYARYLTENDVFITRDSGYDTPYGPSIFVNLGVQYTPAENLLMRIDGYNLLGLIDDKYNKTLYGFDDFGDYRSAAWALGFTLSYKF